jgi:hypothetical protein
MLRSKASKLGARGTNVANGSDLSWPSEAGIASSDFAGAVGS